MEIILKVLIRLALIPVIVWVVQFNNAYTAWKESKEENELIFDINYGNGEFLIQSNYLTEAEDTTPESDICYLQLNYSDNTE